MLGPLNLVLPLVPRDDIGDFLNWFLVIISGAISQKMRGICVFELRSGVFFLVSTLLMGLYYTFMFGITRCNCFTIQIVL